MNTIENTWKHVILRIIVTSGVGILVGFVFYRYSVFIPTMRSSQFVINSISAGLTYAFLKSSMQRHLLPALFVWYIVLTGLFVKVTWWSLILNFAYVAGITSAIFVYNYVANKPYSNRIILRIIYAGAIIAIANGLILMFLGIFSTKVIFSHFSVWLSALEYNVEIGAIIGLAIGVGIEVAEYLNAKMSDSETDLLGEDEMVHKSS